MKYELKGAQRDVSKLIQNRKVKVNESLKINSVATGDDRIPNELLNYGGRQLN